MGIRFSALLLVLLALAGCGPKTLEAKMRAADKKGDRTGSLLDDAERAMGKLEPKEAEEALKEAGELLVDPEMAISPEREMFAGRHAELAARLAEVREARRQRDIEEAVRGERAEIGPSLQVLKDSTESLGGAKVDEKKVEAMKEALSALEKALDAKDERRSLALKDESFGGYLKRAKTEIDKAKVELGKAEKKLKFLAGPVELKHKAAEALKESKAEKDPGKKRALVSAAVQSYAQCLTTGFEYVKGGFDSEKVFVDGATLTVQGFLETCKDAQKSTEKLFAKLPRPKPAPKPKPKKK